MNHVDFLALSQWHGDLPRERQDAFKALHPSQLGDRLLPGSHGSGLYENLVAAGRRFGELAASGSPFYLARVGDCENAVLSCGYFPHTGHSLPPHAFHACGFGKNVLSAYRGELIEAFRNAHLLGVQQNWRPWTLNTVGIFHMLGLPVPHPNAVEVHLPYQMLVDGTLFGYLQGKRIVLVGALAPALAQAWVRTEFISAHLRFGPLNWVKSIQAVPLRGRDFGGGAQNDIDAASETLSKMNFDVALIAAAVPAKIIAYRVWKMGRVALDVGFVFDALLGMNPSERAVRPCFRDVQKWPEKTW